VYVLICKGTNKRAKYQRKTRFSLYFRAKVPSSVSSKVRISEQNTKGKLAFLCIFEQKTIFIWNFVFHYSEQAISRAHYEFLVLGCQVVKMPMYRAFATFLEGDKGDKRVTRKIFTVAHPQPHPSLRAILRAATA
jgi:hypothetical protein